MKSLSLKLVPLSGAHMDEPVDGLEVFAAHEDQPRFAFEPLPENLPLGMYRLSIETPDGFAIDDTSVLIACVEGAAPMQLSVSFERLPGGITWHFVAPERLHALHFAPFLLAPQIRVGAIELKRVSTTMRRSMNVLASLKRSGGIGRAWSRTLEIARTEGYGGLTVRLASAVVGTRSEEAGTAGTFRVFKRRNALLNRLALQKSGLAQDDKRPTLSLIVPIYKTPLPWLQNLLSSFDLQTDQKFELVLVFDGKQSELENAVRKRRRRGRFSERIVVLDENKGVSVAVNAGVQASSSQYVVVIDHDDWIDPSFVDAFRRSAAARPADIYYADEIVTNGEMDVVRAIVSRGQFDLRFYLSHPYIVHPIFVRRQIVLSVGGLDETLRVSQDVDFFLRCVSHASSVVHIPLVLYAWRTHEGSLGHQEHEAVVGNTCAALKRFVEAQFDWTDATVRETANFNVYEVLPPLRPSERAAIVIPTKNRKDILALCLDSIEARRAQNRTEFDIFVIDHESSDPETLAHLEGAEAAGRVTVLRYAGPWNYSAINNEGVRRILAQQDYSHLVFMNNDIELITDDWLDRMMAQFSYGDVGVVGCCLVYPDQRIQHAGVIVGLFGAAEHSHKFQPFISPATNLRNEGYLCSLVSTRDYDAVTGAAMIVPTALFNEVGGFDEQLAVGFNDTDLCLRIKQRGYAATCVGQVTAIHFESVSRGKSVTDPHPADSLRFTQRYADEILYGDPHWGRLLNWRSTTPEILDIPHMPFWLRERRVTRLAPKTTEEKGSA